MSRPGVEAPSWRRPARRGWAVIVLLLGSALSVSACSSSSSTGAPPTRSPSRTLTIMVTNDDGVGAPGINAVVQGLLTLPHTKVTVVAPLTNQSGTDERTTPPNAGPLLTSAAHTRSGYPATAVHGYPADTVVWAIRDHGLSFTPDLVVSGINFGQNIGPLAADSGTVGAAREAISSGVSALAASQGVDNGLQPDFSEGVRFVDDWVSQHRQALLAQDGRTAPLQASLNIPSCPGSVRGPVATVMAASGNAAATTMVDCHSSSSAYTDDLQAFELGFATFTALYPPSVAP